MPAWRNTLPGANSTCGPPMNTVCAKSRFVRPSRPAGLSPPLADPGQVGRYLRCAARLSPSPGASRRARSAKASSPMDVSASNSTAAEVAGQSIRRFRSTSHSPVPGGRGPVGPPSGSAPYSIVLAVLPSAAASRGIPLPGPVSAAPARPILLSSPRLSATADQPPRRHVPVIFRVAASTGSYRSHWRG